MCYQFVERYRLCRCLYHQHSINPCAAYGGQGHTVQEKTLLVGASCSMHDSSHHMQSHGRVALLAAPRGSRGNSIKNDNTAHSPRKDVLAASFTDKLSGKLGRTPISLTKGNKATKRKFEGSLPLTGTYHGIESSSKGEKRANDRVVGSLGEPKEISRVLGGKLNHTISRDESACPRARNKLLFMALERDSKYGKMLSAL